MSKGTYPLKLPASTKAAAQRLARKDGVSLNQWIASAVAQKVGAVEAVEEIRRRWGHGSPEGLLRALAAAPDNPPEPWDRLEEDAVETPDAPPAASSRRKPGTRAAGAESVAGKGTRKPRGSRVAPG